MERSRKARRLAMKLQKQHLPLKMIVYMRSKGRCHYCDIELHISEATLDHQCPVSRGGRTVLDNLVLACAPCNRTKGRKTSEEFTDISLPRKKSS